MLCNGSVLAVICVQVGNFCGRGAEYVNRLRDGVAANLPAAHRFFCLTDDPRGLDPAVVPIPAEIGLVGWWQKLALFAPRVLPRCRVIYFDLDTVILGDLSPFVQYRGEIAMLSDFYVAPRFASGVMMWQAGGAAADAIWSRWLGCAGMVPRLRHGDGEFISDALRAASITADRIQSKISGVFSYKAAQRTGWPVEPRVCCFHGQPRPHDTELWQEAA
jgi:hypothetical protein